MTTPASKIHDSRVCDCDMCLAADEYERKRRQLLRPYTTINNEWHQLASEAIETCPAEFLATLTQLACRANALLLEANLTGQLEMLSSEINERGQ